MRKYLLLAGAALIGLGGSAYAAIDCAVPPTCEELGFAYSSAKCDGQSTLKCPFDQTKVFCGEPAALVVTCTVGAILYDDLKCYDGVPFDKTAVAVVFDTSKRLAISISMYTTDIPWGGSDTDISGLDNCTVANYTSCGTDGQSNTQKIVSALGNSSTYAAGFCGTTALESSDGKSVIDFFLPSMSELKTLYANKTAVNAGLTKAGGTALPGQYYYWSSTESSMGHALVRSLINGVVGLYSKTNTSYARCAVKY